jgi:hypothetical protein
MKQSIPLDAMNVASPALYSYLCFSTPVLIPVSTQTVRGKMETLPTIGMTLTIEFTVSGAMCR